MKIHIIVGKKHPFHDRTTVSYHMTNLDLWRYCAGHRHTGVTSLIDDYGEGVRWKSGIQALHIYSQGNICLYNNIYYSCLLFCVREVFVYIDLRIKILLKYILLLTHTDCPMRICYII